MSAAATARHGLRAAGHAGTTAAAERTHGSTAHDQPHADPIDRGSRPAARRRVRDPRVRPARHRGAAVGRHTRPLLHRHRRPERLRQVDIAARAGPAAQAGRGQGAAGRAGDRHACPPRRWPGRWACCRRARSRPTASPSPAWWPAAATRTRGCCGSGRRRTSGSSTSRWPPPASPRWPTAMSTNCPAASGSGCGSPWPSPSRPRCCCSTSRPRTWTSSTRSTSSTCARNCTRSGGRTLVAVLHDLNQAARYATHLIAMRDGRIEAQGPPGEIITAELVERVFGVRCRIIEDPESGTPLVVPAGAPRPPGPRRPSAERRRRPPLTAASAAAARPAGPPAP